MDFDKENELFLRNHLKCININDIKWADIRPYYTNINGKSFRFSNSYFAHLNKHPRNYTEKWIWKKILNGYPENVQRTYFEYSKELISCGTKNNGFEYDSNNHSLNYTDPQQKIRVCLKKSYDSISSNRNRVVISTCHPRWNSYENPKYQKSYSMQFQFNYGVMKDMGILDKLFASNGQITANDFKRLNKITKKYIVEVLDQLMILKHYQIPFYEYTEAFDYYEIIELIDKLMVCIKYNHIRFPDSHRFYDWIVEEFISLDSTKNVENYIKSYLDTYGCSEFNEIMSQNNHEFKMNYSLGPYENKVLSDRLYEVFGRYGINLDGGKAVYREILADGTSFAIDHTKFSASKNEFSPNRIDNIDIVVLCRWNGISWEDFLYLLSCNIGYIMTDDIQWDLRENWGKDMSREELTHHMEDIIERLHALHHIAE